MNKHAATHRETMALASSTVVAGYVSFLLIFFLSRSLPCFAVSSISYSKPLFQNQTLLSPNQIFELGFFTPNGSSNQYVGMWYKNFTVAKVLWVANRDRPLRSEDRLASLTIGSDGNLRLIDGDRNTVWWANVSVKSNGSTAVLLDTGNLVLRDADSGTFMWESFDYPADTLLPGMKIGINVKTGEKRYLISWKTRSDPSPGMFSVGLTPEVPTQPFIWNGSAPRWRGGQWDKSKFIGIFDMDTSYLSGYTVQQDIQQGTTYYSYSTLDPIFGYMFISAEGFFEFDKGESSGYWSRVWKVPVDPCTVYGTCGPFGICRTASSLPVCDCMEGFAPKSEEEWKRGNWIGGCIRKDELYCGTDPGAGASSKRGTNGTGYFSKQSQLKLPDHSVYLQDVSTSAGCEDRCLSNCSCIAYSYIDNIGCLVWSEELMDIQRNGTGKDLFLRLAHSGREGRTGDDRMKIIIILTTISGIVILGASMYLISRRWRANKTDAPRQELLGKVGLKEVSSELPMLDLKSVLRATDNFCIRNKLGQGGFGPVYKGSLPDGTEVAVKRLSSSSGQGVEEFKNEIVLISKLQHRNLVKIVGCCMEGEERILVYEYLPNKSLDTFLFDLRRKGELTWKTRFDIIRSISRGLVYLHHDSCLRVIHRDLKASNILLDEKMNPKISDFGLARIFQATQDLVNTRRVVGTIGYMSPEYAIGGMFSEKSDVYSFGVLMLEIISGKRNTSLCYLGENLSLLSYAWELWREGRAMELLDEAISADSISSTSEVMKCVQIGLLCIQDHATDRPSMSSVALMLSSEMDLPNPKAPALTNFRSTSDRETQHQEESAPSINAVTCSICEGR